ncbi:MAG: HEAT repeat domain-containing protein, partial [Candidatus Eisenbacteria bacterium]|nr:HEAT repeat domain-containing protein [Candidatus Eisenbacteria bacterium]
MDPPRIQEILLDAETLLGAYEPYALTYLDARGEWRKNPGMLADRVSCELWFSFWEARKAGAFRARAEVLFRPLAADETAWPLVRRLHEGVAGAGSTRPLLAVSLAVNLLVESEAYDRVSRKHVPEWDRRGRATKALYTQKLESLAARLAQVLASAEDLERFLGFRQGLKAAPDSVFREVSSVISEEELVRSDLDCLLAELRVAEDKEEICELMTAVLCPHPSVSRGEQRAFLRPCVELLGSAELDVSSGIQYKASAFLGRLADVRSSEALMDALKRSAPTHSFLRSNLVYALGNLRNRKALPLFAQVLGEPDRVAMPAAGGQSQYLQPLDSEKRETVWALGKLGADAVPSLPSLMKYSTSPDRETRIYLAWAMGAIGAEQKDTSGGIDATIPIALMNVLTGKDGPAFEEASFALRRLGLPDFLHTLYLHDFTTVPILSLKPSNTGLYELSETLLHLSSVKRPVVMAVTGDSGTGKTYFCNAIARGFSGIEGREILYLMRDGPENGVFDRILGLRWLKAHNEARFYENYPVSEDQDDPDAFFAEFMSHNADKKLIILDGWRDEDYFHQVVRKFYEKGHLDVLVRFQTTFSTRRINLEEREGTLERVRMHLPLTETPAMEETRFYQEGAVLIYHLDNSIPSRLTEPEIREVFDRQKVETWGDQIRIGRFSAETRPLEILREEVSFRSERITAETQPVSPSPPSPFTPAEESFLRELNEDVTADPNLLQLIRLRKTEVDRIAFYNHGQLAFCGEDGSVGVLTGFNDRVYETAVHENSAVGIAVVGGDVCSVDLCGRLAITSFKRNTVTG